MKKLFALAGHSFRESLHSRVMFFILFFVFLMFLATLFIRAADDEDRVKVLQSVSFIVLGFFGSLLSLLLPVISLTEEMETKKLYTVLTKPVNRFVFLLGKIVGILAFVGLCLAVMGLISYLFVFYSADPGKRGVLFTAHRFKTASRCLFIRPDGTRAELAKPEVFTHKSEFAAVRWVFRDTKEVPRHDGWIRAKLDLAAYGVGILYNIDFSRVFLRAVDPRTGGVLPVTDEKGEGGRVYTIVPKEGAVDVYIPARAVSAEGRVVVEAVRPGPKFRLYPGPGSLRLYKRPGTYAGNFVKTLLFLFLKCIYLACVAVCGAAFFSMMSGITFGVFVILMSHLIRFIRETAAPSETFYQTIFFLFRFLAPDFADFNTVDSLISGLYIPWGELLRVAATGAGLYALGYLLLGYIGLREREL